MWLLWNRFVEFKILHPPSPPKKNHGSWNESCFSCFNNSSFVKAWIKDRIITWYNVNIGRNWMWFASTTRLILSDGEAVRQKTQRRLPVEQDLRSSPWPNRHTSRHHNPRRKIQSHHRTRRWQNDFQSHSRLDKGEGCMLTLKTYFVHC